MEQEAMRFGLWHFSVLGNLAVALMAGGCSKSAETQANVPVPAMTLDFATSRALTAATMAEIFPDFTLTDPELVPEPMIFGYGRLDSADLREPVILRRVGGTGGAWKFVELPSLNHMDWVYAGAAFQRNELWAILDSTGESKEPGLFLFNSADRGQTWKLLSGLKPPTLSAEFVGFTMDVHGIGRITVHQDDDIEGTPRGLYAYATSDDGRTWTGPTFAADDLVSSEMPLTPTLQETLEELDPDGVVPGIGPKATQNATRGRGRRGR